MIFLDLETIPDEEAIASPSWTRKKEKALKNGKELTDHKASFSPVYGKI